MKCSSSETPSFYKILCSSLKVVNADLISKLMLLHIPLHPNISMCILFTFSVYF